MEIQTVNIVYGLLLTILPATTIGIRVVTPPKNQTVLEGSDVILTCGVSDAEEMIYFQWTAHSLNSVDRILGDAIFQVPARPSGEPSNPAKYTVKNKYDLEIKNVTLNDSGWYACRVQNMIHVATLIVFERPQLILGDQESFVDGETTDVECIARYGKTESYKLNRSERPWLAIVINGRPLNTQDIFDVADNGYTEMRAIAQYKARPHDNNGLLLCVVRIPLPSPNAFEANATRMLSVKYGPLNITFNPIHTIYAIGDVINCIIDANPLPEVKWISNTTAYVSTGSSLTIRGDMMGENQWICEGWQAATNETISKMIAFEVVGSRSAASPRLLLVQQCLLVVLLGLSVLMVK